MKDVINAINAVAPELMYFTGCPGRRIKTKWADPSLQHLFRAIGLARGCRVTYHVSDQGILMIQAGETFAEYRLDIGVKDNLQSNPELLELVHSLLIDK